MTADLTLLMGDPVSPPVGWNRCACPLVPLWEARNGAAEILMLAMM